MLHGAENAMLKDILAKSSHVRRATEGRDPYRLKAVFRFSGRVKPSD